MLSRANNIIVIFLKLLWVSRNVQTILIDEKKKTSLLTGHCSSLIIHTCQTEEVQPCISVCLYTLTQLFKISLRTTVLLDRVPRSTMLACPCFTSVTTSIAGSGAYQQHLQCLVCSFIHDTMQNFCIGLKNHAIKRTTGNIFNRKQ